MSALLQDYFPILIFIGIAGGLSVVMVVASTLYDEAEYLRDYELFKREAGGRR